ncbi:MAG: acetyl-CoA carboxylase biotin carboxyl carrier protein [Pseudomonadota bacterium]|jgi:acetyl-CoA carboxylase biotin carboxyl carrier protein|uniref:Biotin carboxyl carrier protein of acetyl-CoA carboxylase n=1 Tax=Qipengyuania flava TaxID=192812 RepID=A0A222EVZ6_9SPHN|nr:acetyl-CoA carboxylase biotin carboxyl carrier protein [Qipengyuania flava]KZX53716.1 acetyl-CoA carboxylase, biotin carboxyl carrier protein [Erythrobacter sp. HI00D59]KZX87159.1 acetyl-CoA carboxylase, biotin carboxyl carrier protein [Erythrobacter sp. HI0020]KZY14263.1 acetyl-CoA carboxylase, biotin carboxyl carrier protein [Erythrobacter sp. HI0037]KZY15559.1 acetyl-CoA carboxylase, biotin carboxyl carrier protein [Erythrobacter sp. HI0038]MEC7161859.1 acetyl-CoA carboxylase biotin carb
MADRKGSAGKSGMNVDTALVRELAEMLGDTGLTEIEVEDGERKIRVSRGGGVAMAAAPAPVAAPAPAAPAAAAPVPESAAAPEADTAGAIKSPMVGTVYLASEPGAANFVKVGDSVTEGQTLLIVEAMKVMNPITADKAGTVKAILVENAQPVEFDQPLVVIG